MGIKNVVNIIIQRLNPSIVKSKFVLKNGNILNSSIYWKLLFNTSKKSSKRTDTLKTIKDHNNENFFIEVLLRKNNAQTNPKMGNKIITSNIKQKILNW